MCQKEYLTYNSFVLGSNLLNNFLLFYVRYVIVFVLNNIGFFRNLHIGWIVINA